MPKALKQQKSKQQPFQTGQIWRMAGSWVEIGVIGKRLVHYKLHKGVKKGSAVPFAVSAMDVLAAFLQKYQAKLERK